MPVTTSLSRLLERCHTQHITLLLVVLSSMLVMLPNTYGQLTATISVSNARCHGLQGKLEIINVLGGTGPYYYSLDSINYTTNPTLPQLNAGNYLLYLRDDFGNSGKQGFTIGQPAPFTVELVSSKTEVAPNEEFTLEARFRPLGAAVEKLIWRPQNKFPESEYDGQPISILQNTMFWVEARDTAGCRASTTLDIKVHDSDIYIPNIISAGDTGNEVFTLYGASKVDLIKQMTISDRYGKVLFSKSNMIPNDTQNGWTGRTNNNIRVLPGVYLYECIVKFHDGQEEIFRGDITVIH